jgi:hypothetical protein
MILPNVLDLTTPLDIIESLLVVVVSVFLPIIDYINDR